MNENYFAAPGRLEIGRLCIQGLWIMLLGGVLLGMSYLWIYSQVIQTSNALEIHENRFADLADRALTLQSRLETLQSPHSIARMLQDREIALADPEPRQIVRVRREEFPEVSRPSRAVPPRDLVILSIAR